ncbi:MAG TPA: PAS domain S-box protein [Anaerolineales bacterium]|nr:PAS domain S-box protein [Anaerolineales bacterium]
MNEIDKTHLPEQETSEETIKRALLGMSIFIFLGMGMVTIIQLNAGFKSDAVVIFLGMIPILTAVVFAYKQRLQVAATLIAISLTITITALATIGQGIYDIGTMSFPAILIIASLILKRNMVLYLAGVIILCNGWLVFGAVYGVYEPAYPVQSSPRQFFITTLILLITLAAVHILSNTVRNSLRAAQDELQERRKIELALRETETMYRALVEQTSVVIYRDAPQENGATNYISPQIEDVLGYPIEEWNSNPELWKELTHPDDMPLVLSEIKNYLASGKKSVIEYRMKAKDGRWVWFQDESIVIKDDHDEPLFVHGVLIEITERKNTELKVRQRESIISAVASTAQLLLKSTNWRDEINSILKLLGEATGASHVYVFENHDGEGDVMLSSIQHEWTSPGLKPELNNPQYKNTRLVSIPGIEDWYINLSAGKPFYGSKNQYPRYWKRVFENSGLKTLLDVPVFVNGQWWGIFGFDDFTNEMPWSQAEIDALVAATGILATAIERQNINDGLRASEEKFNLAFRHTYVAMAISQTKSNILLDVNNSFCKVTGYSKQDAIGKRAGKDLNIWVDQKDRNSIIEQLDKQGVVDEYKAKFRRKNGEIGTGLLYVVKISIAGQPCHLYSFIDISNIDQLLDELKAKNDELQSFTYTVSHDLKSPLVTISGFMGYLEQDALNGDIDKLNKDILRINEAVSKMQRLLNELLELSRVGRMMNPPENVPFAEIVQEALELVDGQLQAGQVQVLVDADLPSVFGDRARLVQVVQNLVDNAAKFMRDRENPRIEIGVDREGSRDVFFVRDNGAGIEPEYFERIFGLFNKLDTDNDGTGVGLALVKRIIEVHGGKIWVESKGIGEGSTFYFTLANQTNNV